MVLDEKSAEKLFNRLRLGVTDEGTYKVAFENERGTNKNILSPGNRWLEPNAYSRIFGKKFMKDIGFDVDKPKGGTKSKIPKKTIEQIEQYVDEIDDNRKQFASELREVSFFTRRGGLLKIGGGSSTLSKIKRGDQKIFSN